MTGFFLSVEADLQNIFFLHKQNFRLKMFSPKSAPNSQQCSVNDKNRGIVCVGKVLVKSDLRLKPVFVERTFS